MQYTSRIFYQHKAFIHTRTCTWRERTRLWQMLTPAEQRQGLSGRSCARPFSVLFESFHNKNLKNHLKVKKKKKSEHAVTETEVLVTRTWFQMCLRPPAPRLSPPVRISARQDGSFQQWQNAHNMFPILTLSSSVALSTCTLRGSRHHHPSTELFSSYKTETLYSLNNNPPIPSPSRWYPPCSFWSLRLCLS